MTNIYLTGFMGSGKSSVGSCLSLLLDCDYLDTDTAVEKRKNKTIAAIFLQEGESAFRTYESNVLTEVSLERRVVSTGGGIVEEYKNIEQMRNTGIIVYLATSFTKIDERLKTDQSRPLWNQNRQKQKQLYEKRIQLYRTYADITVMTDDKSINTTATEIRDYLINE